MVSVWSLTKERKKREERREKRENVLFSAGEAEDGALLGAETGDVL